MRFAPKAGAASPQQPQHQRLLGAPTARKPSAEWKASFLFGINAKLKLHPPIYRGPVVRGQPKAHSPMLLLLQRDQDLDDTFVAGEGFEGFAEDGAGQAGRVGGLHGVSGGASRIIVIRRYGNLGGENLTEQREQKKRSKAGLLAEMHKPSTKRGIRKAQ